MSVLMKALEKAAQDRDKAPDAAPGQGQELSLEPVEPKLNANSTTRASSNPSANTTAATTARGTTRSAAQMSAATVLNASETKRGNVLAWLLAHPVYLFGAFAGLFLLAYGAYVYVQIAHPSWLIASPPPVAAAPKPAPANPAPPPVAQVTPPAPAPATSDSVNPPLPQLQSVFGGTPTTPAAKPSATPAPIEAKPAPQNPAPALAPPPAPAPSAGSVAIAPAQVGPQQAIPLALPRDRIAINRGDAATPRVNPTVSDAYAALEAGQYDNAQRLYSEVLRGEPNNVDALLGLAAIAQKANRNDDAQRHFMAILNVEPRHALAQAGLLASLSRAEPLAAESRLKQLIAREPSAPLYFNLGNLYADQGLWPQAQQAYFQAHDLDPKNPDYAHNLAVGLEHLNQPKLALGFYRKAQQLAAQRGGANFDVARTQERITRLSTRFE